MYAALMLQWVACIVAESMLNLCHGFHDFAKSCFLEGQTFSLNVVEFFVTLDKL
jgi:hypothetical protein